VGDSVTVTVVVPSRGHDVSVVEDACDSVEGSNDTGLLFEVSDVVAEYEDSVVDEPGHC
jgi:hypothetical protein